MIGEGGGRKKDEKDEEGRDRRAKKKKKKKKKKNVPAVKGFGEVGADGGLGGKGGALRLGQQRQLDALHHAPCQLRHLEGGMFFFGGWISRE